MFVPRRVYYDITTGSVIQQTGNYNDWGLLEIPSIEQDVTNYIALAERARDTFNYVQLAAGQFDQDFVECNGYRVNTETGGLEFSYPDPNQPSPEIVYRKPLSVEVDELKNENAAVIMQVAEIEMLNNQLASDQAALLMQLAEKGVL